MANYEHLPIYKKTMELAVHLERVVKGFSRYHKYTIGSDMRNLSRELIAHVIKANSERDKTQTLTALRDKSEEMKTLIILAKEIRAFRSFKQFQSAADACRIGKGTHAAVNRLQSFMRRITKGVRVSACFIQLDIRSFFMSIDREILLGILNRHVRDKEIMSLAEIIVNNDCTKNYVYNGDRGHLRQIPPHKSLFHIPAGKGLPIGNLTSQFLGIESKSQGFREKMLRVARCKLHV